MTLWVSDFDLWGDFGQFGPKLAKFRIFPLFGDFRCFIVKIELKRYTAEFGTFFVNFYEGFYFENIEIIPPNSLFLQVLKNSISEFKRYTAEFEAFLVNFIVTSKTPNITYTPLRSTPKVSKFCHFGGCF